MAKTKSKQTRAERLQAVKMWNRGEEIPPTMLRSEFANGLGLAESKMNEYETALNILPLYQRAPGQTKGWPSVILYTRPQMEMILAEYEKSHVPPPPTPEERMHAHLDMVLRNTSDIQNTLMTLVNNYAGMRGQLDEINTKVKEMLVQEHGALMQTVPAAILDNANEMPSQQTETARVIRRRNANA
jgi:hypothetical protein